MADTSITALRRFAGIAFSLLFFSLCLCVGAAGQGASPLVTSSAVNGLAAPPSVGAIWQTAVSSHGDFLVMDFDLGLIYVYPANGGPMVTLTPAVGGGCCWSDGGLALDQWDNVYLNSNWDWDTTAYRLPYDPVNHTWNMANGALMGDVAGVKDYQNEGLASNSNGLLVVGGEDCCGGIWSMNIDSSGKAANGQTVMASAAGQIHSLAVDNAGNIFMFEPSASPGILMIPAGTTGLANEKTLNRVDPTTLDPTGKVIPLLSNISGMTVDAVGNLYVADGTAGVFMVPNQAGVLNPAAWLMLTPVPTTSQPGINRARDTLYLPIPALWNGFKYVATASLGSAELGSSPVGTQNSTPTAVYYSFSGLQVTPFTGAVTPAKFVIQEDGAATPDFTIVAGGSCAVGTTYPIPATASANAVADCTLNVALNPQHVGSVSGQLLMQTAQTTGSATTYTTVATTTLHGTGLAGAIAATPALESAIGSGLKTPSQVATDAAGNIYVADAGLGKVLMYAQGSGSSSAGASIGTGLVAPTGVAVDGNGDVFIADSTNVYEVPFGVTGLNAANQVTLATGLGANLTLAADGLGRLYVADPANARVVELYNLGGSGGAFGQSEVFLTSGFKAPSYVAVDASNNLYVIDGANLFEIASGVESTLLTTLSTATGVAVDPSGAVYVTSSGGTERIPFLSGALVPGSETAIAASVTNPTAVALDNMGNAYLTDGTALNIHMVSPNGSLNFGNVPLGAQPSQDATITNLGNLPLTITGYTSTNAVDYTGADVSCVGSPVAVGGTCQVDVTLAPGPGEQGTLTGAIGITSTNAANGPVVIDTTGVSAPLAVSVSGISVASTSEVVNTQVSVTVKAQSGIGVPTGTVTVSFTTVTGATGKVSGPLVSGSATLTLSPVAAGSNSFTVSYSGDRVYGRSTATVTSTIAKSAIAALALPAKPPSYLPYVLEQDGSTPYDGSADYWQYNFIVTVSAAAGQPTGTVTFMDGTAVACPAQSSAALQTLSPSGQATFSTSCLPMPQNLTYTPIVSTHVITPVYGGDANYLPFTGQATTFIAVRSPVVAITSSAASLSVSAGSSASANLTLTSVLGYGFAGKNQQLNDYNFPVSLTCDNLPPHATCSFSYPNPDANIPTAVDIPCTGTTAAADDCSTGLVTVTINTDVAVGTTTSQLYTPVPVAFAALFGFGMLGLYFRRKAAEKARLFLMLSMVVIGSALAISLTACATTNLSPASVLKTPAGTYAVTVTAQQVGSQVITLPTGPITIYGSQNQVSLPFTISVTVQ